MWLSSFEREECSGIKELTGLRVWLLSFEREECPGSRELTGLIVWLSSFEREECSCIKGTNMLVPNVKVVGHVIGSFFLFLFFYLQFDSGLPENTTTYEQCHAN